MLCFHQWLSSFHQQVRWRHSWKLFWNQKKMRNGMFWSTLHVWLTLCYHAWFNKEILNIYSQLSPLLSWIISPWSCRFVLSKKVCCNQKVCPVLNSGLLFTICSFWTAFQETQHCLSSLFYTCIVMIFNPTIWCPKGSLLELLCDNVYC